MKVTLYYYNGWWAWAVEEPCGGAENTVFYGDFRTGAEALADAAKLTGVAVEDMEVVEDKT